MLRRFFLAALLILLASTSVFAMKNEPDGFGGIKWGDKLSQHPGLKHEHKNMYYRPNEKLRMGQAELTDIIYCIDKKEGFYLFMAAVQGSSNVQKLKAECWSRWGKPDLAEPGDIDEIIGFQWQGKQTNASLVHSAESAWLLISDFERHHNALEP